MAQVGISVQIPECTTGSRSSPVTVFANLLYVLVDEASHCTVIEAQVVVVVASQIVIHVGLLELSKDLLSSSNLLVEVGLTALVANTLQGLDSLVVTHIGKHLSGPLVAVLVGIHLLEHGVALTEVGELQCGSNLHVGNLDGGSHSGERDEPSAGIAVALNGVVKGLPVLVQLLSGVHDNLFLGAGMGVSTGSVTSHLHQVGLGLVAVAGDSDPHIVESGTLHLEADDVGRTGVRRLELEVHTLTGCRGRAHHRVDAGSIAVGVGDEEVGQGLALTDDGPTVHRLECAVGIHVSARNLEAALRGVDALTLT